jgi:hypothetical protein
MVLTAEGTGDHLWGGRGRGRARGPARRRGLFDEIAALVRDEFPALDEAVAGSGWSRPRCRLGGGGTNSRIDLAGWRARVDGPLEARPMRLAFTPSPALAGIADPRQFMLAYLASCTRGCRRVPSGRREEAIMARFDGLVVWVTGVGPESGGRWALEARAPGG